MGDVEGANEELVLNAVQPRMRLGERAVGLVRVDSGPWLYLALVLVAAAFALVVNHALDFAIMSLLLAALSAMRVKGYAMVLTDEALYVVPLRGRPVGTVEAIRPLVAVGFERNFSGCSSTAGRSGCIRSTSAATPTTSSAASAPRRPASRSPTERRPARERRRRVDRPAADVDLEVEMAADGACVPGVPHRPHRSPAHTRSPRCTDRRPPHVGVEVAAVLAAAVDQQEVPV